MEQVLLHPEMGGFAEADIMVLKNPQRQDMEEAIENLFAHRQKDDLLVLFFSGDGIKDDTGRLFLATRTTRKTAPSLANLSSGWVIKTNNAISLGNNQSLPPGAFLEVINTKPNPKPASLNFSVSMRVCANKSTQTPAKTNNPAVTSSVPSNSKPLPATVLLDFSQLKRFGVSVLQSDAPSPCRTVTQPPVTEPPDTSPT